MAKGRSIKHDELRIRSRQIILIIGDPHVAQKSRFGTNPVTVDLVRLFRFRNVGVIDIGFDNLQFVGDDEERPAP